MGSSGAGPEQIEVTEAVLDSVRDFLGGPTADGSGWTFEFGEHLESNWGAVYGGALAAGTLALARVVAPDRSPRSLHLQIVRSVPRGAAYATAKMRHAGRTVGTVEVDVFDARRKLAAIALVTMVTPGALAGKYHDTSASPLELERIPLAEDAWAAPIVDRLDMLATGFWVDNVRPSIDGTRATGLSITVPWETLDVTGPEAACLVADAAIGGPLTQAFGFDGVAGPNADLTLRFTTAATSRRISGIATMLSVQHGTATVEIDVRAEDQQLAHGLATSLLLEPR